jgi:hypothetical protein
MNFYFLMGCLSGVAISQLIRFLSRDKEICMYYGIDVEIYKKMKHSEQQRVKYEWDLDNDPESIKFMDNLIDMVHSDKNISPEEAKILKNKYDILTRKFGISAKDYDAENYLDSIIAKLKR